MPYPYSYDYDDKVYTPTKLKTDRSMWKLILFSILTFGLYTIIFFIPFSFELDKIAPKRDGSKTINFLWIYILGLFTFSIVFEIWFYQITQRMEEELIRRDINYDFSTRDFWKWYFFGSLILIGPFIYFHKFCKAMNLLCNHYNENPTFDT